MSIEGQSSAWMQYVLRAAAVCSIGWGLFSIADPSVVLLWAGMQSPLYLEFLQCIGMISTVCGVGFAVASLDPLRHWLVVLVGMLVKVLGPIGFAWSATRGRLPWKFGWTVVATDLIWSVPFALILLAAYHAGFRARRVAAPEIQKMALRARTQYGLTLLEMSKRSAVMLVFLRHTGCPFCREALADIAARISDIQASGTEVILVHMGDENYTVGFFRKYGLDQLPRVSDPERKLYRAFGLGQGSVLNIFGPKVWWRSLEAGLLRGHGVGLLTGDSFQMPGVFVIFHGEILRGYQHHSIADRPDYLELAALGSMQI